jgi:NAD(P)H-hydrate epimerase
MELNKVYSVTDIRNSEKDLIFNCGINPLVLMEMVSVKCSHIICESFDFDNIAILCGPGNNGGDGYAIARDMVLRGKKVRVVKVFEPETEECILNSDICKKIGVEILNPDNFTSVKGEIMVDAVFGSGFYGKIPDSLSVFLKSELFIAKVAIDNVSGLDCRTGYADIDNLCCFDMTIAVGGLKKGYFSTYGSLITGELKLVDIGLNLKECDFIEIFKKPCIPDRRKVYHKGKAGKVYIISGSHKYRGAAALCSKAALVAGAGLVYCCTEKDVDIDLENIPEIINIKYSKDKFYDFVDNLQKNAENILIGPGISNSLDRKSFEILFERLSGKNIVLDAECFKYVNVEDIAKDKKNRFIITPHIQELSRFLGKRTEDISENEIGVFEHIAEYYPELFIVMKKPGIFMCHNREKICIPGNHPSLSHGGSGDVLAGLIVSWICNYNVLDITNIASIIYFYYKTAEKLEKTNFSTSVLPSDIIDNIGRMIYEEKRSD